MQRPQPKLQYEDATQGNEQFTNTGDDTHRFIKNINPMQPNSAVPPPPKPGEVIHCQICREAMYPKDFSTDTTERKWEFKWQTHWKCRNFVSDYLDRITPGLLSERQNYGISGTALVQRQLRNKDGHKR